jgi:biopolymer transport protein TolR
MATHRWHSSVGTLSAGALNSDINVTPLVDVCLVLLIIFMVVTPMLQRGKDVKLPKAVKTEKEKKDADPLILSVTSDKLMFLEQDKYDDENLQKAIHGKLEPTPNRKILLKGDQTLTFGDVRKVMNIARKAGAKGISLGVEEVKP